MGHRVLFYMKRGEIMYAYLAIVWLNNSYHLETVLLQNRDGERQRECLPIVSFVTERPYAMTECVFIIGIAAYIVEQWRYNRRHSALTNIENARTEAIRLIQPYHHKPIKWYLEQESGNDLWSIERRGAKLTSICKLMEGRSLLWEEFKLFIEEQTEGSLDFEDIIMLVQVAALQQKLVLTGAIRMEHFLGKLNYSCRRCYNRQLQKSVSICMNCGTYCLYCPNCLNMGRSRWCEMVIQGVYVSPLDSLQSAVHISRVKKESGSRYVTDAKEQLKLMEARGEYLNRNDKREGGSLPHWTHLVHLDQWGLSHAQAEATKQTLHYVSSHLMTNKSKKLLDWLQNVKKTKREIPTYLIWAVTGAGKTEMIFPIVDYVTKLGGRVLIASPRRDVVIELDPRIRRAFPATKVVTLYGGSPERWSYGDIVLSTTHQLMRFHQAFELVIIDEVDAFPYHGDPLLYKVAESSCSIGGVKVLLSATPPPKLQRMARLGQLAHTRVPVRYHRHPLPVPQFLKALSVKQMIEKRTIPNALKQYILTSLQRGAQLFFFVQRIAYTEPFKVLLQHLIPNVSIAATSSKDVERAQKVSAFRACSIRILVTTTILERGVTIPKSDVYIFDADGTLFDESSLVQMGGRAGRSADDPKGKVYFIAEEMNSAQRQAIKQIKMMNRIARKKGYLLK